VDDETSAEEVEEDDEVEEGGNIRTSSVLIGNLRFFDFVDDEEAEDEEAEEVEEVEEGEEVEEAEEVDEIEEVDEVDEGDEVDECEEVGNIRTSSVLIADFALYAMSCSCSLHSWSKTELVVVSIKRKQ
jgi:hypothetical protein